MANDASGAVSLTRRNTAFIGTVASGSVALSITCPFIDGALEVGYRCCRHLFNSNANSGNEVWGRFIMQGIRPLISALEGRDTAPIVGISPTIRV